MGKTSSLPSRAKHESAISTGFVEIAPSRQRLERSNEHVVHYVVDLGVGPHETKDERVYVRNMPVVKRGRRVEAAGAHGRDQSRVVSVERQ